MAAVEEYYTLEFMCIVLAMVSELDDRYRLDTLEEQHTLARTWIEVAYQNPIPKYLFKDAIARTYSRPYRPHNAIGAILEEGHTLHEEHKAKLKSHYMLRVDTQRALQREGIHTGSMDDIAYDVNHARYSYCPECGAPNGRPCINFDGYTCPTPHNGRVPLWLYAKNAQIRRSIDHAHAPGIDRPQLVLVHSRKD